MTGKQLLAVLLLWGTSALLVAQASSQKNATHPAATAPTANAVQDAQSEQKPPDYSEEPFVIEQVLTRYRFENDGTSRKEFSMRVRVQSESGVQQFGQIVEGYNSGNERMDVAYVRVKQPDGKVITAGPEAVQDLTAPVAREAFVYTDYRQKHITVPALRPGDTLEFQVVTTMHTPLALGQFWMDYDFVPPGGPIVLSEQLEASVPSPRTVKLKTAEKFSPKISEESGRRFYRWTHSRVVRESDEELKKLQKDKKNKPSEPDPPDVQLTTFPDWEAVGHWYSDLERERRAPSQEIKAKVAALVAGRTTDMEKVEAIYDYVAKNFRYVSLSFGLGRYQPHAAGEILANQYGDCKDKHTLLASLLDAAGFRTSSVLIHTSRKLDPEVPSPSQFDHIVSMVVVGTEQIWLDTTTEVAPFRVLMSQLRNKQALVIAPDGTAKLVKTPASLPFPGNEVVEADGKITPTGKLNLHVKVVTRGENETLSRMAFRQVAQPQWKQLLMYLAMAQGNSGEVSDPKVDDPAATRDPFHYEFNLEQGSYFDWSKKKESLRLPFWSLRLPPEAGEDSAEPVKLGGPSEYHVRVRLEIPEGMKARPPVPVTLSRDYGDYSSQYRLEGNTLIAERKLTLKPYEIAAARNADYAAFRRTINQDEEQHLTVDNPTPGVPKIPETAKGEELYEAGNDAFKARQYASAIELFQRAVALEPKHKYAWNNLGRAYLALEQYDKAAEAFKKQIEINPFDEWSYNNLGRALQRQRKFDEAAAAYKKQIEVNPLDRYAHTNLGGLYLERKQYAEAAAELEKAAAITPEVPDVQVSLGQAYLNTGQAEKAVAAFDRAVEIAPVPPIWNNVAYQLAQNKAALERARQYAESAVTSVAASLRNLTAETIESPIAGNVSLLAASWDTLGWVRFQQGDLDGAEKWINSAWLLAEHGEVGDHLAQIYERRGDKQKAMSMYAMALTAYRPPEETRARLAALAGSDDKVKGLVEKARQDLMNAHLTRVGKLVNDSARAEFKVLLSSGPKVEAVRFLKGSETLKPFADKLRSLKYDVTFPDNTQTKVVIRGVLTCAADGDCVFIRNPQEELGVQAFVVDMPISK